LEDGGVHSFRLLNPTPGNSNVPGQGEAHDYEDLAESNPIDLSITGTLQIGTSITFDVDGTAPNANGGLYLSLAPNSNPVATGVQLIDLSQTRGVRYVTDANGDATVVISLPNVTSLVGLTYYSQAITAGDGWSQGIAWTIDM